ncbi:DUF1684 domain-containing protein [Myroides sp. JBRI-B21084]|uniref:DUF1684 domain-containing protein n=1 Tax=Myroides sp. JBRI-B21084 TaxID=3119977 RepID=UPI0026E19905|nr:DUF1684 domain-containing protein [Paenimyroides cloacae]WKW47409.1 DUF1684 domain-containing protein [Paenimyroides cloacae]
MRNLLIFFLLCCNLTFSQHHKKQTIKYQKNLNKSYFNKKTSPLQQNEIAGFKGLKFYEYNENFIVNATLEQLYDQPVFKMPTSGNYKPDYKRFGILHFEINNQKFKLEVYQNLSLISKKGFENHLFLPFLDETSGNETYGAGRYLDIEFIPNQTNIILNFNKAYHPYCAYTTGYSCPITPDINFLNIAVTAGVKL